MIILMAMRVCLRNISAENTRSAMECVPVKNTEVMWVSAIYLRHIEDVLTGKRDLNN